MRHIYTKAGNTLYKKPVSGLANPSVFGYVYGINAEGLADAATTLEALILSHEYGC